MPKSRKFSLAEGQPPSVEITWRGIWKEITVTLNGQVLGTVPNQKALKEGRDFPLPDGGTLRVQLKIGFASAELQVLRNGHPLPGSGSDPAQRVKVAAGVVWFIAALNIVLGLVVIFLNIELLARLGIGWAAVIEGALYAVLAFFVGRRSALALGLAIALFALDSVVWIAMIVQSHGSSGGGGIVMRIVLFLPMLRGFRALKELKERDRLVKAVDHAF